MKTSTIAAASIVALAISACAKSPESIAPSYVSEVPYQSYSCSQLGQEKARLEQAYSVAAKAQSDARTGDAVGVFFLGMPTSTLSGGNIAPEIANLKGQMTAVDRTIITKNCTR